MAAMRLKSSHAEQRLVVETVDSLGLEVLPHTPYSSDFAPSDYQFFDLTNNVLVGEICLRHGGAMGRSSVACAAADFVFLHRACTNLFKDWTDV